MFYLVGLGIGDEKDLSVRGLEIAKSCEKVYVEFYTSRTDASKEKIEKLIGKEVVELNRGQVEEESGYIEEAKNNDVCLLVGGDPLTATTHVEILLRCIERKIEYKIIHASSIFTAIAETGLQLYKFGKTTTLAYPEGTYFPMTPYGVIGENLERGLHTLILLDIKPDKNMTASEAIGLLEEMETSEKKGLIKKGTKLVVLARAGTDSKIWYDTIENLKKRDFGKPQHIVIYPGKLHFVEEEFLKAKG
ncbi:diphthine synthase [Candidatus Undinarchaeota archaeon]